MILPPIPYTPEIYRHSGDLVVWYTPTGEHQAAAFKVIERARANDESFDFDGAVADVLTSAIARVQVGEEAHDAAAFLAASAPRLRYEVLGAIAGSRYDGDFLGKS